ncbi:RNA polymerase subunit sigma-70 [Nocardioides sp.]|jgi:RNA polymerase sigma-70 factor (ECF subfamily)|uniref:RNA polymerase subunit sigma-70 n=1 Tax=Nocardioides sp. TaxID=35761 RepID=UPI002F4089CA
MDDANDMEAAFERHRRELHVHCYRMLASYDDAEDAVQETYLRAWRGRDGFDGDNVRAWLYRIATHVCIDRSRARQRRVAAGTEVSWLTAYPDTLLDEVPADADQPDQAYVARETIELAFLTALQVLPPRQRATLLAREVLGLPAADTARLLETSVAAANSALQRARETMRQHLPSHRGEWSANEPSADERQLLATFIDAHERCDAEAAVTAAATDIRVTMPPNPAVYDGLDEVSVLIRRGLGPDRAGDWRLLPIGVNRMPAAVSYLRRPGDSRYRAFKVDVLRIADGQIAEITTLGPARLLGPLGLPETLG